MSLSHTHPPNAELEAVFHALGRALLLVDRDGQVVGASETLNDLICESACTRIIGRTLVDIFGHDLMAASGDIAAALGAGRRSEGRRALIQCGDHGARFVSASFAPIPPGDDSLGGDVALVVVLRPAEDVLGAPGDDALADIGLRTRAPAMLQVVRTIAALQRSDATVLISGESGVGKEVVARLIHGHSTRSDGPFVAVNCAALPSGLLESELFGHVKGAFTGADKTRVGRFQHAGKGTLFLDEIGDLPAPMQVKLLRVLQEREYERVGDNATMPFSARVIAATNVDIDEALASGQLREDLYYRLRVVPIHIPPLRERMQDMEFLVADILRQIGARYQRVLRLSPDALALLETHHWPGNIRELYNKLEFATTLCQGAVLGVEHFPELTPPPPLAGDAQPPAAARAPPPNDTDEAAAHAHPDEAAHIRAILEKHHWRRADAARELGMSRTTLWRRMQALGIG